jgi:hypothetical protein
MVKTEVGNEVWEISGEKELDKYFPKGDNRRGQAMVILATVKLEIIEEVKKIIDDEKPKYCPFCSLPYGTCLCPRDKILEYSMGTLERVKHKIEEMKK